MVKISRPLCNSRQCILEMNNMNPSYTRQHSGEWEAQQKREAEALMKK